METRNDFLLVPLPATIHVLALGSDAMPSVSRIVLSRHQLLSPQGRLLANRLERSFP